MSEDNDGVGGVVSLEGRCVNVVGFPSLRLLMGDGRSLCLASEYRVEHESLVASVTKYYRYVNPCRYHTKKVFRLPSGVFYMECGKGGGEE